MKKGFVLRFLIYGLFIGYFFLDINVIKGPLHGWVHSGRGMDLEQYQAAGVVATVYGKPLYADQVDYRVQEYLYRRGTDSSELSEVSKKNIYQDCLEELILEELLRVKTHFNQNELGEIQTQVAAEVRRDEVQFSDENERHDATLRQGYGTGELALRAQAYAQQLAYLDTRINVNATIVEEEITVPVPPLRKVRHIFYPTWQKDAGTEVRRVQESLAPLRTGWTTFQELSDRINGDPAAKKSGGNLGWVSPARLPEGLAETLFAMEVGEKKILQSNIGWHYIEVLDAREQKKVSLSQGARELIGENNQRKEGLALYLYQLREREKDQVQIIPAKVK